MENRPEEIKQESKVNKDFLNYLLAKYGENIKDKKVKNNLNDYMHDIQAIESIKSFYDGVTEVIYFIWDFFGIKIT